MARRHDRRGLDLRSDLAAVIRRHRPEVVVSINFRESWGGPSWNHADHGPWAGLCSMPFATQPTRGSSLTGVRPGMGCASWRSAEAPSRPTPSTRRPRSMSGFARSRRTARISSTSAATWLRPTSSCGVRRRPLENGSRVELAGNVRGHRLRTPPAGQRDRDHAGQGAAGDDHPPGPVEVRGARPPTSRRR